MGARPDSVNRAEDNATAAASSLSVSGWSGWLKTGLENSRVRHAGQVVFVTGRCIPSAAVDEQPRNQLRRHRSPTLQLQHGRLRKRRQSSDVSWQMQQSGPWA